MTIQRALFSVSDKAGLVPFAQKLHDHGVELLSTGGTAKALREAGLPVIDVSEYTGAPELFEGRVKTLHPKVHGGLLFRRDDHAAQATDHDIPPIDLLVVNLYPFEATVAREDVTLEEAIEQIDIGGPALLRGASKNYRDVTVITDPADYDKVLEEMAANDGNTTLAFREALAIKVYQRTGEYDQAISNWLVTRSNKSVTINLPHAEDLRYGDNPHQKATLYGNFSDYFTKLQGKGLSYTNILDIESASALISEFEEPTVAILKHTNPCGVGSAEDLVSAWDKAFATDQQAPFGGVIVMNRPMTGALAEVVSKIFTDVIIAPGYEAEAMAIFSKKKNLRLMQMSDRVSECLDSPVIKSAPGGLMVMDNDSRALGLDTLLDNIKTKRQPTASEIDAMKFGWRIVKHVKSNAIVFTGSDRTLGIGAGQMSRVDSCRIAVWKAHEAGLSLDESIVASDALFPFADGLITAAEAGAKAAIQPGGSIRDEEVIAAADERDMAMVFTGHRHFRH
ncbi:bifunctional phosphoribosylaminoimidazolecarboxamide formyltransferase/IMP cyclohydrolase [Verrucomicrobiales bacterium]|nr:bifunctional phosphoribosylaminoimidazolecarboxamide formyltransferase/IMP cyclohydrolase [Verrucomicrobiales bacterium]